MVATILVKDRSEWREAMVDEEDFDALSAYRWYAHKPRLSRTVYAKAGGKPTIYMHRLVAKPSRALDVDHIDGNGLNNTRANLRSVSRAANLKAGVSRRAYDGWKARNGPKTGTQLGKTAVKRSGGSGSVEA